jgi:competence protein ComEA
MHFSKTERIFSLFILALAFIIYGISFLLKPNNVVKLSGDNKDIIIDSFTAKTDTTIGKFAYLQSNKRPYKSFFNKHETLQPPHYFYFDPNTISVTEWNSLGVKTYVAQSIAKYISKGGRFTKPEDLYRIFLLPKPEADKLVPYVRIEHLQTERSYAHAPRDYSTYKPAAQIQKMPLSFDINNADTSLLKQLDGIGSTFASRIVNYRKKLGGFTNIEQVTEIYGISSELFHAIKPFLILKTVETVKININQADMNTLLKHPYFTVKTAKAILNYRVQHGNTFTSLNQLKNILLLDEATVVKITPYLTVATE